MAETSKIQWTDFTANFWWGCKKVSPACKNCYAEKLAKRWGHTELWKSDRQKKKGIWKDLLKWDKEAGEKRIRYKVFVSSMSDIFEDNPILTPWRNEAFDLMDKTENLDFQILTKRPDLANQYFSDRYPIGYLMDWLPKKYWIGTTVENQEMADLRIPELIKIPAHTRFLSCEPLLEAIDLPDCMFEIHPQGSYKTSFNTSHIDWVIIGGESGPRSRPMEVEWVRHILSQLYESNASIFFKQGSQANWDNYKDFESFPEELQIREFPS